MRPLLLPVLTLVLSACQSATKPDGLVSDGEVIRIERHGLAAEFTPAIDRITYFGRAAGRNVLHLGDLKRAIPSDDSYTFWGGCYTWVSPQKQVEGTTIGWINAERSGPQDWPPDPAMDIGPARRAGQAPDSFSFIGPDQRTGLSEEKEFRLIAPDIAELTCTLRNRGASVVKAGPWTITAAAKGDTIAVRLLGSTRLRGWDQGSVDRVQSITSETDARGWATINLSKARWDEGVKVYFTPSAGSSPRDVEIAVWSRDAKAWLHRSLGEMTAGDAAALEEAGEGPVAVYIQPNKGREPIFEAELYGPLAEIPPGGTTTTVERWRIIPALRADTALLP